MKTNFIIAFLFLGLALNTRAQNDSVNTTNQETPQNPFKKKQPKPIVSTHKVDFKHKTVVFTQPFKALANYMLLGIETRAGEQQTFRISAGFCSTQTPDGNNDIRNWDYTIYNRTGYLFEVQFRNYIGKSAKIFNDLYFGPYAQFKMQKVNYDIEAVDPFSGKYTVDRKSGTANCFNLGYIIGKQKPLNDQFILDFWIGQGIYFSSGKYEQADRFLDGFHNAIRVNGGIALGLGL